MYAQEYQKPIRREKEKFELLSKYLWRAKREKATSLKRVAFC